MNHTKIQYVLIAHREIIDAKQRMVQWQHQFMERLASLDHDEVAEFKKEVALLGWALPALKAEDGLDSP